MKKVFPIIIIVSIAVVAISLLVNSGNNNTNEVRDNQTTQDTQSLPASENTIAKNNKMCFFICVLFIDL